MFAHDNKQGQHVFVIRCPPWPVDYGILTAYVVAVRGSGQRIALPSARSRSPHHTIFYIVRDSRIKDCAHCEVTYEYCLIETGGNRKGSRPSLPAVFVAIKRQDDFEIEELVP